MQTTTANYQTEEARQAGAKPKFYVTFMRTYKTFGSSDYSSGTHTNTEFSGGALQLQGGQSSGNWVSATLDTGHLTPNIIFDKITWTETLNGGTVTVQIRTASTEETVSSASYVTYTNATLDHTERYRYYQIKVSITKTGSTPTIETLKVRHKALIPKSTSDYIDLGVIDYGISVDYFDSYSGDVTIEVANESHQFDVNHSSSYIFDLDYYYQPLEIWAGFQLEDSSIEWLNQFIGEIEGVRAYSGIGTKRTALITARDFFYRKFTNTRIGKPLSTGDPNPYMQGKRYRVPCKEIDESNYIYQFYCQQSITSIDAVYIRDSEAQKWVTAPSNTPSVSTKTITFASDPGAEVAVDITVSATNHPIDVMYDILQNELSLDSDNYDSTSMDATKSDTTGIVVGVSFDNMTIYEAFKYLLKSIDASMFIEGGQLKVKTYQPDREATQTFTTSVQKGIEVIDSIGEVQNKIGIFYGNYTDDTDYYVEAANNDSIDKYGELTKDVFSFKYEDPVTITSTLRLVERMLHWLDRQKLQYTLFKVTVPLEIMRTEIFDIVGVTDTQHGLSDVSMLVLAKKVKLGGFNKDPEGQLLCIRYTHYDDQLWLYWNESDATTYLRYLVDYPVPAQQESFQAYYY